VDQKLASKNVARKSTKSFEVPTREVVRVDYNDIVGDSNARILEAIQEAYGPDGLGIMAVENVPGLMEKRAELLPLATKLANLPDESLRRLEDPESHHSFGWSHGKEMLEGGVPDTMKGSFYANPHQDQGTDDPEQARMYPSNCRPNIWPRDELPELEPAIKGLGQLVLDVGMALGHHCDTYVHRKLTEEGVAVPEYKTIAGDVRYSKGRLLHFFPQAPGGGEDNTAAAAAAEADEDDGAEPNYSSWCGWHKDHGLLTGLVSGMYTDGAGNPVPCPDPRAGLYIRTRSGEVVHGELPADCLAFQVGEVIQLWSGGHLQATPHCVKQAAGPAAAGLGCNYFVHFMNPHWLDVLHAPSSYEQEAVELYGGRWEPGGAVDYGEFSTRTYSKFAA